MQVTQIYQVVNDAQKEVLGESAIATEDLSQIVDVGTAISSLDDGFEHFYNALVNRIGAMIFVDRAYRGKFKKIFKKSWEFGSILGKVQAELMDATENESWQIVQGASYDPYVVNLPVISSKFYNKMVTLEIDITSPVDQIKQSFKSADEMIRFVSMLEVMVLNSLELKMEILASRVVNNFIANLADAGGAKVVNLVSEYNVLHPNATITATTALTTPEFLRYATSRMMEVKSFLAEYSTLYNIGGKARFTPADMLHLEIYSVFASRCKTYLQSDTFHKDLVELPNYEEVAKWQGTGTTGTDADRMKIDATAITDDGSTKAVSVNNVVAVMFDHDALGILQPKKKVRTAYNPKADYYNSFNTFDSRYFNDFNENGVVFTLN
ncbi:hypothetical protein IJ380_03995 [Candidatus Saccharibacteria bacterium]|nr:hypothetical protein [Candidatus Saccharibacteria bacterium]